MKRPSTFLIALAAVATIAVLGAARTMPHTGAASAYEAGVRDYLMRHPEVARDVLAQLEARATAPAVAAARAVPTAPEAPTPPAVATATTPDAEMPSAAAQPAPEAPSVAEIGAGMATADIVRAVVNDTPAAQIAGNPNGDVSVVMFFDYRCPYCKASLSQEKIFLAADGNARIVYRDLAILGEPSVNAARAALAAARQHKYLPFHDALMAYRGEFTDTDIFGLAMQVGLDIERLKADMQDPVITATLTANLALARALKVEGTPAFVVGDRVVSAVTSAEDLHALADQARADAARTRGQQIGAR